MLFVADFGGPAPHSWRRTCPYKRPPRSKLKERVLQDFGASQSRGTSTSTYLLAQGRMSREEIDYQKGKLHGHSQYLRACHTVLGVSEDSHWVRSENQQPQQVKAERNQRAVRYRQPNQHHTEPESEPKILNIIQWTYLEDDSSLLYLTPIKL